MNGTVPSLQIRVRQRGYSLVELMVASTIGLIILGAVGGVYLNSRNTYRTQEALARMQENARYAMEVLGYDLRMAGQIGCSFDATKSVNVLNDASYGDLLSVPIQAIAAGGTVPTPFTAVPTQGDAVRLFRADDTEVLVQSHNAGTATFTVSSASDLEKDEIAVVTDCDTAAVFQLSNPASAGGTVEHLASGTPGNCTQNLGEKPLVAGACNTATSKTYAAGSKLYKVQGNLYYIADNPAGIPALYRQRLVKGAPVTEEIIEGVADMRVSFGLDTDANKSVDSTQAAGGVTDWTQVQSVQVSLLMQSDDNAIDKPTAYTFNGATVTPTDRRLRTVFNTTVAVRIRQ